MSDPSDASRGRSANDRPVEGNVSAAGGAPASRPSDGELSQRLQDLDSSLGKVRARTQEPKGKSGPNTSSASGVALAFRLGAEFVSGVLVGSLIGYGIDYFLAISPWGLIVFTLVGFGAGVLNMLRAAEGRRHDGGKAL
ncbi:AtpZ/AtpI family protein [Xanthobacter tagetidis]|jgi:ATP synthase protein I|uniref:F0F1 ATP synthase assembly protein I n=1 Tax=Xanthobacter tagetidis TaxID=60216 RepID=A0A3L7A776_9HYPH|nr:AtpZ/AtpI family protein [Xanthobacter tagetidis]MBB6306508.1 ATP synthase protein I [Xanthobacter tagetidis]RLP76186.1 F0F1 ATP synthase assembly protein I [Xanthobacter tagetidis]